MARKTFAGEDDAVAEAVATDDEAAVLGVALAVDSTTVSAAVALVEVVLTAAAEDPAAASVETAPAAVFVVDTAAALVEPVFLDVVVGDALVDERVVRGLVRPTERWAAVELAALAESSAELDFDPEFDEPTSVAAEATPWPAATASPMPTAAATTPLRAVCVLV
ncbi:hypothetical protein CRM90_16250 [Mycobacterium sp. ENV421]|uniref:hypothetical protein n=1 Tax=Mycobacterium sp. ENV421 TaxID=1213407 RepID=UPI000C9CD353|nr:hypothetical protein [Mycobacterium sp. ENV421]PND56731.1 hypothetical protein CRM90_16250 [Mycobacterium sp. ENV421]